MRIKKSYFFIAKLVLTTLIILYLLKEVNVASLINQVFIVNIRWYLLAILVGLFQVFITSMRWVEVSKILRLKLSKSSAIEYTFIGQFFNQLLPSSIGGDAARIWVASEDGHPVGRVTASVLCDRFVGMAVVVLIGLLSIICMADPERSKIVVAPKAAIFIAVFSQLLVALFFYYGDSLASRLIKISYIRPVGLLLRDIWLVLFSGISSLKVVIFSALIQLMIVISIYIFACGLGANLSFVSAVFLVPIIMLVAMMPLSFAGWGVREAAMVYGLGLAGVSEMNALAISIMFGFFQVALGLPGALLWIRRRGGNEKAIPL